LPTYLILTPQHWQVRATEMRALAASVEGRDAQDTMLRMAEHYDRLAARAAERPTDPVEAETPPQTRLTSEADPAIQSESVFAWWLTSENANPA
jgi:hypothetical protein